VKGYSSKEILLGFDEPIDPVFSLLPLAYKLDGIDPEIINSLNDSTRILRFEENLEEGKSYRLDVMQIPDLEGNFLRDTSVNFRFTDPTSFDYKSLVINELMPAPRADQDLPN
ncbi:Ig-like domain-containing protein, partial [Christiangramia aquimixticola]